MASAEVHNCSLCSFFSTKQDDLLKHVLHRHQHDANFIVHCSATSCGASFNNYRSFKTHVMRWHLSAIVPSSDTVSGCPQVLQVGWSSPDYK